MVDVLSGFYLLMSRDDRVLCHYFNIKYFFVPWVHL